ncbi:YciI family protein [Dyadobacter bucti]|uniref:YciI family protein n=1 Tax=Dyadobacter bucti TaxID=2572203 RepID=UPI00140C1A77|nr:YciI family protein [Dyadobacter bucti]
MPNSRSNFAMSTKKKIANLLTIRTMAQYLLNFHHFPLSPENKPSASDMEAVTAHWQHFIADIARQGKFIGTQRLDQSGSILGPGGQVQDAVKDGHGLVVGTLTLEAQDLAEAVELSRQCPVLQLGGSVEVRPIIPFEM